MPASSFPWYPSLSSALAPETTQQACSDHSANKINNIGETCRVDTKEETWFFFPPEELVWIFSILKGVESFFSFENDLEVNLHITLLRDILGTQLADLSKDYLKNTLNNFIEELISFIILSSAVNPLCSIWRDNFPLSARSLLIKQKKKCCTVVLLAEAHPANTEKYHLGLWQTSIFEALWYWSSPCGSSIPSPDNFYFTLCFRRRYNSFIPLFYSVSCCEWGWDWIIWLCCCIETLEMLDAFSAACLLPFFLERN